VIAAGATAVLLTERDRQSTGEMKEPTSKQSEFFGDIPLPVYHHIMSPYHAQCESIFGKWSKQRATMSYMDAVRDKRRLKTVYSVNWETPLGEGGFGAVYPATDRKTNEKVALKKISKKFTDDDGFRKEMEALLKIRKSGGHPNLCGLHENFDEGGHFYLTLDLISGGEMFDHLINAGVRVKRSSSC
jgi:hypothetical protein